MANKGLEHREDNHARSFASPPMDVVEYLVIDGIELSEFQDIEVKQGKEKNKP